MRKLIMLAIGVMALAIPSIASADVPRYQSQTATFTMVQPANEYGQWLNLWTHDFTVTTNPCDGTFSGSGIQTGHDANGHFTGHWTINGTFGVGTVSFTAERAEDHLVLSLANAPMNNDAANNGTVTVATLSLNGSTLVTPPIEEKVSPVVVKSTSTFKNHGDYVSSQGGGSDAAHSCIGMPLNSQAPKN